MPIVIFPVAFLGLRKIWSINQNKQPLVPDEISEKTVFGCSFPNFPPTREMWVWKKKVTRTPSHVNPGFRRLGNHRVTEHMAKPSPYSGVSSLKHLN